MPRIRKKTSKRGTTHKREKLKHQVSEGKKKKKKEAKKNPQWKSKHKKDPGIPNNFPYKDQILAEVAEERRQAEEAKQRKKDLKKALKAGVTEEVIEGSEHEGSEAGGFDGVTAVRTSKVAAGTSKQAKAAAPVADDDGEDDVPVLMNSELPSLKAVLEAADVVVEVLDARDPLAYHSAHLAELVKGKEGQKLLLVLNKIDASPREAISSWAASLRAQNPTLLLRSASAFLPSIEPVQTKGKGKERADDALGSDTVLALFGQWAEEKAGDEPLVVAIVGLTNAGKSSFVNSLVQKSALSVYQLHNSSDGPSTTTYAQEVSIEVSQKTIRLIDTPGYLWSPDTENTAEEAEGVRARDILARNKGRIERLKDPQPVVHQIVSRASAEDLMLFYNLPAFADKDTNGFLSALARANGLVKKGGVLDVGGASRIVLRDWSTGKLPRYTVPAASSSELSDPAFSKFYAEDEKILSTLLPRKELRKSEGLVKLIPAHVESRQLALEASWIGSGEDSAEEVEDKAVDVDTGEQGSEADADGDDDEEDASSVEGEVSEDEDETGSESEVEPLPIGKRKRSAAQDALPSRPKKKVAFAEEPKSTKQARKAAGARGSLPAKIKAKVEPASVPSKHTPKTTKAKPSEAGSKKVANSGLSKKSAAASVVGNADDEEYDFKKFF